MFITVALPEELSSRGPNLDDPAGQALTLNHWGHGGQAVPFHQPARYPCWRAALSGRDDYAKPVVPATAHCSAPGIHHEADQEAEVEQESLAQINDKPYRARSVMRTQTAMTSFHYCINRS